MVALLPQLPQIELRRLPRGIVFIEIIIALTKIFSSESQGKSYSVNSISEIQSLLGSEGIQKSELEIIRDLIAEEPTHRFAKLSSKALDQVAEVLLLAERNPNIGAILLNPNSINDLLPSLIVAEGFTVEAEALAALSQPQELNDDQLEQVVGGIDPLTASLITLGITTVATVVTLWINRHYDYMMKQSQV
ncbi:MAG: hypothetical protein NTZ53_01100 [Cyanobacteria bacterium]|nr:hypothetical protein [Cyanobacteriota bacterium]